MCLPRMRPPPLTPPQEYLDKTVDANNPARKHEDREAVTFAGPVDSVYLSAPDYTQLDVGTGEQGRWREGNGGTARVRY